MNSHGHTEIGTPNLRCSLFFFANGTQIEAKQVEIKLSSMSSTSSSEPVFEYFRNEQLHDLTTPQGTLWPSPPRAQVRGSFYLFNVHVSYVRCDIHIVLVLRYLFERSDSGKKCQRRNYTLINSSIMF